MAGIEDIIGQRGRHFFRDSFERFNAKLIKPLLMRHVKRKAFDASDIVRAYNKITVIRLCRGLFKKISLFLVNRGCKNCSGRKEDDQVIHILKLTRRIPNSFILTNNPMSVPPSLFSGICPNVVMKNYCKLLLGKITVWVLIVRITLEYSTVTFPPGYGFITLTSLISGVVKIAEFFNG